MGQEQCQGLHSSIPYLIHPKALCQWNQQLTSKGWNVENLQWKEDFISP